MRKNKTLIETKVLLAKAEDKQLKKIARLIIFKNLNYIL